MQPKWAPGAFLRLRLGGWELRGSCPRPVALQAPTHQNGLWSGPLPLREASAGEGGSLGKLGGKGNTGQVGRARMGHISVLTTDRVRAYSVLPSLFPTGPTGHFSDSPALLAQLA